MNYGNSLRQYTVMNVIVIRVANYLLVNVYLSCVGSNDRLLICDDIVMNISAWRDRYLDCKLVIAGDFNVDLDKSNDAIVNCITAFAESCLSEPFRVAA